MLCSGYCQDQYCYTTATYKEVPIIVEYTPETPSHCLKTTSLPTSNFDNIHEMVKKNDSLKQLLGSQGHVVSEDKTCAYTHESTYEPSNRGHFGPNSPCFLNQDRGGFFKKSDGTNGACICDGVGGMGNFGVFFAQMVADYVIDQFLNHQFEFTTDENAHQQNAVRLFQKCRSTLNGQFSSYKELPFNGHNHGATTVAVATCIPIQSGLEKRRFLLQTAAIGDSAIIHLSIDAQKASLVTPIPRLGSTSAHTDSLSMSWVVCEGEVSTRTKELAENDIVVLCTDGFHDNVRGGNVSSIVELVAFSTFFDQPLEQLVKIPRPWEAEYSVLPTVEDLQNFMNTEDNKPSVTPSPSQVTERLSRYIKVVTWYVTNLYEDAVNKKPVQFPPSNRHDSKTDDCLIIAFKPSAI